MKRTYIDASVLIAAFRGNDETSRRAIEMLDDPARKWIVSDFLRLETVPKPTFHKQSEEVEFMNKFFDAASEKVECNANLTEKAIDIASKHDVSPIDALHLAAAVVANVEEFVTIEKPTKPLFRVKEVKVLSLYDNDV